MSLVHIEGSVRSGLTVASINKDEDRRQTFVVDDLYRLVKGLDYEVLQDTPGVIARSVARRPLGDLHRRYGREPGGQFR